MSCTYIFSKGEVKLSDFGIARELQGETVRESQKKTPREDKNYIAIIHTLLTAKAFLNKYLFIKKSERLSKHRYLTNY